MLEKVSERVMHRVRWVLTLSWLTLIASFFYDPFTSALSQSDRLWSPFHVDPRLCVEVQGICQPQPAYAIGAAVFWGIVIPVSIFSLLVFGHEFWRRICPLSFLSQIPRKLGWQRQITCTDRSSGRVRVERAKIKPNSWLGRNYTYVQFGWLYLGLCGRILFFNSNRVMLGFWMLGTIAIAIAVGYCFDGKSWCQYFCPMATVQRIYATPLGLFTTPAQQQTLPITQSMCRKVTETGTEKSNCVACQTVCLDINVEREYWTHVIQPQRAFIYYAYAGLVIGYFLYYYLYSGNWNYYFSGIWAHDPTQLDKLMQPGFYLFHHPIAIPKLVAVPMTLGGFSWLGYRVGKVLEKKYRAFLWQQNITLSKEEVQHQLFSLVTYGIFNVYFIFGGRPFILLLPLPIQSLYNAMLGIVSTFWLCRVWACHPTQSPSKYHPSPENPTLAKLKG